MRARLLCVGGGASMGVSALCVLVNVCCVKIEGETIDLEEHEKFSVSHTQRGRKLYCAGGEPHLSCKAAWVVGDSLGCLPSL